MCLQTSHIQIHRRAKMAKVNEVLLDEIIELAPKLEGRKLYKFVPFRAYKNDIKVEAIIDAEEIYHAQKECNFYSYKIVRQVLFDQEMHPHWRASFGGESFKLYDSLFIGHHGCGGYKTYTETLELAKKQLSELGHEEIFRQYREFFQTYLREKEKATGDQLRGEFGISVKSVPKGENFAEYIKYENNRYNSREEKDLLIFWRWFRNKYVDELDYKRKIDEITNFEHKRAFDNRLNKLCVQLENAGFTSTA